MADIRESLHDAAVCSSCSSRISRRARACWRCSRPLDGTERALSAEEIAEAERTLGRSFDLIDGHSLARESRDAEGRRRARLYLLVGFLVAMIPVFVLVAYGWKVLSSLLGEPE